MNRVVWNKKTETRLHSRGLSARTGLIALVILFTGILGGITVLASARIMVASHELAKIQQQEAEIQQSLRFLETQYAQVSSLERVQAFAEQAGLTQSVVFAGTVSDAVTVAQRPY